MNLFKHLPFLTGFFLFSFFQDNNLPDKIQQSLIDYYSKYPAEKIYLQTDETYYTTGENIWYKIYATANNLPTALSKVIYVQLINERGNVMLLNKHPLLEGNGNGDIQLNDSLASGYYQLKAFTSWSLNFDDHFAKTIYIKNVKDTVAKQADAKQQPSFDVHFFPEGGDLIDSNLCHLAFKSTDQSGLPAQVYGEIIDDHQKLHLPFQTYHDGMGKFDFRPFPGNRYFALVHLPDSSVKKVELPASKPSGISMHIGDQLPDSFDIAISYKGADIATYENLILAVYQNSVTVAAFPLQMHRGKNVFTIPKTGFTGGILRLTLFDITGNPLAERIIFHHPDNTLNASLRSDTFSTNARGKSAFTLQLKDRQNIPVKHGTFSVSVTDADRDNSDSLQGNILTAFYLTNELKSYIHHPAYYFSDTSEHIQKALDLVMQTNGWRRFEWKKIFNQDTIALRYPAEQDLYVAGEVTNYEKVVDKNQFVLNIIIDKEDSSKYAGYIPLNKEGKFILENYNFTAGSRLYFKWHADKNTDTTGIAVKLYTSPVDSISKVTTIIEPLSNNTLLMYYIPPAQSYAHTDKTYNTTSKSKNAANKIIPALTVDELIKKYTSPYFQTPGTFTVDMVNDSFPTLPGFYQLIRGRIPSLTVSGNERNPQFAYHSVTGDTNATGITSKSTYPYFYINEVLVSYETARIIPLESIALVRFIPSPFPMAPAKGGSAGTIAIYLKKGSDIRFRKSFSTENGLPFIYNGYSITRQFYQPVYSRKINEPDARRTLYWNPDCKTDIDGNFHFSFYHSDYSKKFRITIEGMDDAGRLLHFTSVIEQ